MKKWNKEWEKIMAVTLAALIAGSTVEPSALAVAAAGQKQEVTLTAVDTPDAAVTGSADGKDSVSGNSVTAGDSALAGENGIATLAEESGSTEDVVSLTIGETTTNYTSVSSSGGAANRFRRNTDAAGGLSGRYLYTWRQGNRHGNAGSGGACIDSAGR